MRSLTHNWWNDTPNRACVHACGRDRDRISHFLPVFSIISHQFFSVSIPSNSPSISALFFSFILYHIARLASFSCCLHRCLSLFIQLVVITLTKGTVMSVSSQSDHARRGRSQTGVDETLLPPFVQQVLFPLPNLVTLTPSFTLLLFVLVVIHFQIQPYLIFRMLICTEIVC